MSIETTILEKGDFTKVKKIKNGQKINNLTIPRAISLCVKNNNLGVANYAGDFLKSVLFIETKTAD